jgi:hypothetical protein
MESDLLIRWTSGLSSVKSNNKPTEAVEEISSDLSRGRKQRREFIRELYANELKD